MQNKERIIRIFRIIMPILSISIVLTVPPLDLLPPMLVPLPETVQEQVDKAIDYGLDGIIVYVDRAGEAPAFYAAGWKDKGEEIPADPHALFNIGSISKLYIATAVAKLTNDGVLSLDETLTDYLPELFGRIENADQITLRMMVQHRSGIPNFTDQDGFDWLISHTDMDKELNLVLGKPADFAPDAKYSYSNTNYLLIGRILDNVLGYDHQIYIAEKILAPLGLENTFASIRQADYENVASGYWYEYDDDLRQLEHLMPGGSMVSTAEDVGLFLRALNDGSLLNDDEQAIYSSLYEYEHTGWVPGYFSIARYHADLDTVVVQFVSTTGGDTWGLSNIIGGKATGISNIIYNRIIRILRK